MPHSDIPGSKPAGGSPGLIAAIHVLHRLLVPRHPPCALASSASRSLDLTKPAGSMFSTFALLNYSAILQVLEIRPGARTQFATAAQKRPDIRRATKLGARKSSATYVVGDSDRRMIRSPRRLRGTRQSGAGCLANLHYIQLDFASASAVLTPAVEPRGFEPLTSAVQRRRSPN